VQPYQFLLGNNITDASLQACKPASPQFLPRKWMRSLQGLLMEGSQSTAYNRDIHGYTWIYRDGYTGIYKDIQGCSGILRDAHGIHDFCKNM